jgi:hypothetical protein
VGTIKRQLKSASALSNSSEILIKVIRKGIQNEDGSPQGKEGRVRLLGWNVY